MKLLVIAALIASQIAIAAQPVAAAELIDERPIAQQQRGSFAGARLRVPFGGRESGKPRASLSLTSMSRAGGADGPRGTRFADGVELSLAAKEAPTLRLGGAPVADRLAAAQGRTSPKQERNAERQDRTAKKIGKGLLVVAIVGAAVVAGLFLAFTVACDDNRCSE
jgi:hypothetical protein